MRLHKLQLKNIGSFKEGKLDFITENDNEKTNAIKCVKKKGVIIIKAPPKK